GVRPLDGAQAVLRGEDLGAVDLEVDELLGVDRARRPEGPDLVQMLDDPGGGLSGIVPSAESREGDSTHQPIIGTGTRAILGLPGPPSGRRRRPDMTSPMVRLGPLPPLRVSPGTLLTVLLFA